MSNAMFTSLFFLTLLLTLVLFIAVYLSQRRKRFARTGKPQPPAPAGRWKRLGRGVLYALKLTGFTLLALVLVGGGVMLYADYSGTIKTIAPAHQQVDLPADLPFQVKEVTFPGGDGLDMAAWFVPSHNGATVILLHGYGGTRLDMLWHARVLAAAGYGVLLYDERGSGESDGERRSYGWEDPADVGGALDYLGSLQEVQADRIGIAGCSIGAQIALQGAARYPQLQAVWADGTAMIRAKDFPAPANFIMAVVWVSNYGVDWISAWKLGMDIPPAMVDIIGTIAPRPVMLVAGGTSLRPFLGAEADYIQIFYARAGENAGLWVLPEATHCDGPNQRPEEYAARMTAFFDRAFGIKR